MLSGIFYEGFEDVHSNKKGASAEDRLWLSKIEKNCLLNSEKHYKMPLSFKNGIPDMSYNRNAVI